MTEPERDSSAASPWTGSAAELIIAAVTVVAAAVAGYATAGWMGLAVVAVVAAAVAVGVIRFLLPQGIATAARKAREKRTARPVSGYSHRRFVVESGIRRQAFYDAELRPVLEHLLAARLAERHGVNLYQDPATARRLLCGQRHDAALWQWVDPNPDLAAIRVRSKDGRGIPRHVLVRLIDRLEKL